MPSSGPSFFQLVCSVLAAFFGVQSEHNRQRDFSRGSAWPYLVMGLLASGVFVIFVILLVRWALSLAGA